MASVMSNQIDYRACIQKVLEKHAKYQSPYGDVETEIIADTVNDHYQLLYVGWEKHRRVHGSVFHIDIKNDKIWIQYDGTETGVANDLVELGVPKENIVLAFHEPSRRPFTGFAVA